MYLPNGGEVAGRRSLHNANQRVCCETGCQGGELELYQVDVAVYLRVMEFPGELILYDDWVAIAPDIRSNASFIHIGALVSSAPHSCWKILRNPYPAV